ncbi:MAG: thioredoxin fold domain-containing protein [Neptuniibacter sp.]
MKCLPFFIALAALCSYSVNAEETRLNEYSGSEIEAPYWFKDSFLDLSDDIQEAQDEGKKLLIYYHQAGCPYCYNLVQQSFLDPAFSQYIQDNFDLVALDLWGDREVTLPDGTALTEKELAIKWKIQYTPTLLFYSESETPVLRIDGYRSPEMLAKIMDYVVTGNTEISLAQKMIQQDQSKVLYPSELLLPANQFKGDRGVQPVALLFEYPGCEDCVQLHKKVLSRSDTHQLMQGFKTYRFDVSYSEKIDIGAAGQKTAAAYAEELGLTYFPSIVLLDTEGAEQLRIDGYVQSFHFNTALEYVSEKAYQRVPEFQRYINERADRLREEGQEVVITQ